MADEEEEVTKPDFLSPNTLITWSHFQSHSPIILLSDPNEIKVKPIWSTPTTVIFPPTNHENLNQLEVQETCTQNTKPSSPEEIVVPVSRFKLAAIFKVLFRFFNFPILGSTVLMVLLYLRFRKRRRLLVGVIKEKDERIKRLLHQIARMNELLLAKHHGVPMITKAVSS